MSKEIKTTKKYNQFKKLAGNRGVDIKRINKIIKSIQKVGYITNPIIVNENMEVIDGQGRLEALEAMHMPVDYLICEGIGFDECVAMNINKTNWSLRDYIDSHATRGNENYIKLKKLIDMYPMLSIHCFAPALYGIGKFSVSMIANGDLIITDREFEEAVKTLDYVIAIEPHLTGIGIRSDVLIKSIMIVSNIEGVDKERLADKIINEGRRMQRFKTINECIQSIEEIYNYKLGHPIYIYTEYRKLTRENGKRGALTLHVRAMQKNNEVEA